MKGTLRDLSKAGRIAFEQNELVFIYFIHIDTEQFLRNLEALLLCYNCSEK